MQMKQRLYLGTWFIVSTWSLESALFPALDSNSRNVFMWCFQSGPLCTYLTNLSREHSTNLSSHLKINCFFFWCEIWVDLMNFTAVLCMECSGMYSVAMAVSFAICLGREAKTAALKGETFNESRLNCSTLNWSTLVNTTLRCTNTILSCTNSTKLHQHQTEVHQH